MADKQIVINCALDSRPRYGYGSPPHKRLNELLGKRREVFRFWLGKFLDCYDLFENIAPVLDEGNLRPAWHNNWISGFDLISLCGLINHNRPRNYIEIGSGNTTKFARETIQHYMIRTRITSIDPQPRATIDRLCDTVIRERLEDVDLQIFQELYAGDIVFMDGSHHTLMNSDASVFFLDILPNLPPGVFVGIHDIFWPDDYPPDWSSRYYSEQYLLAAYLLAEGSSLEVVLANNYIAQDRELSSVLNPLWVLLPWVTRHGAAFWMIKR
ncbi:MAG: class I SAM-dependent methyltransferase [Syntrophomonadaceae bacterium]|nr:class I SAM-dependent methyltransferase [Syntrophomonadaceae bacterium]